MATPASTILGRARTTLQDADAVRWSAAELRDWLNAGQREILVVRPDACNLGAEFTCAAGVRQQLPSNGVKLIGVTHNTNGIKRAVTACSRDVLDAQVPGWRAAAARDQVIHFMFDEREPRYFDVYPPASTGNKLFINYAATPVDLTSDAQNINVGDVWANALLDYVLFRAFSKDAEAAGMGERALAHLAAFNTACGVEVKATTSVSPAEAAA